MKKHFSSNQELSHIWASQTQSEGYANNLSFKGGVLISYRTPIAELCKSDSGETIFIADCHYYSWSTGKHQSYAWRAVSDEVKTISALEIVGNNISGMRVTRQSDFDNIAKHNERRATDLLAKAERARVHGDIYESQAYQILCALKEYAQAFGFEYADKSEFDLAGILDNYMLERKLDEARVKAKLAARIADQAEKLQEWREGKGYSGYFEQTALRINFDKQIIETSHSASIPLDQANQMWRLVSALHEKGKPLKKINHKIGQYTLNSYADDAFTIGCHTIPYSEFKTLAVQLQYITEEIPA